MWQWSADWIYGIVAVMLFGTVILHVTPEGTYQKYVRLFLGALLMLAVLSPLFSLLGLTENVRLTFEQGMLSSWLGNFSGVSSASGQEGEQWQQWQVPDTWEQTMQEQIRNKQEAWMQEALASVTQEYGFSFLDCEVEWNAAGDWPEKLTVWVEKENGAENEASVAVGAIEPVAQVGLEVGETTDKTIEVQGNQDSLETGNYYEPSELRSLHYALQTVWQLEEEQILLYWQR